MKCWKCKKKVFMTFNDPKKGIHGKYCDKCFKEMSIRANKSSEDKILIGQTELLKSLNLFSDGKDENFNGNIIEVENAIDNLFLLSKVELKVKKSSLMKYLSIYLKNIHGVDE